MTDSAFRYHLDKISITDVGLSLIKRHEGFEPYFYRDSAGVLTIGYGTTLHAIPQDADWGEPISETTAAHWLRAHLNATVEPKLRLLVSAQLTRNEFSALCSLVYNIGTAAFADSTMRARLNRSDYEGAAQEFGAWVYYTDPDTGRKMRSAGLERRREAERLLFTNHPDGALDIDPLPTRGLRPIPTPDIDIPTTLGE